MFDAEHIEDVLVDTGELARVAITIDTGGPRAAGRLPPATAGIIAKLVLGEPVARGAIQRAGMAVEPIEAAALEAAAAVYQYELGLA